jgi:uncharacterized protein YfdQ (DUF2303 family)
VRAKIAALTEAATQFSPEQVEGPGNRTFLVTREDQTVQEITPAGAAKTFLPDTIRQSVTMQTAQSLGAYLDKFKSPASALFANIAQNQIVGALDYHSAQQAALVSHKATLALPFSAEWNLWTGIDGKLMSQLEFARFLDENSEDISSPRGADLVEIVKDMIATETANTTANVKLESDNVNFTFTAATEARSKGGTLDIPKEFELRIPVYFGEHPVPMKARLRYATDGGVKFGVMLMRKEQVRQDEFMRVVEQVSKAADLPVFYGALA